jgi:invasion protein IalB
LIECHIAVAIIGLVERVYFIVLRRMPILRALFCLILGSVFLAGPAVRAQEQGASPASPLPERVLDQPDLAYSAWAKMCPSPTEAMPRAYCLTTRSAFWNTDTNRVDVMFFETDGGLKVARLAVPLGVWLQKGVQLTIDRMQPVAAPYNVCMSSDSGCAADIEATDDLIAGLLSGRSATVRYYEMSGQLVSVSVPITGFADALYGAPLQGKPADFRNGSRGVIDWSRPVQYDGIIRKPK